MSTRRLQIVADANIPFVAEVFSEIGDVMLVPGHEIGPREVNSADVALIRSVTRIDAECLAGSGVRFVGSATAGVDHVDLSYLRSARIGFAHSPGANAESVVEYVLAGLFVLATRKGISLTDRTVGIVGCGAVGSRLAERLSNLGVRIVKNDPPLARQAEKESRSHPYVSLDALVGAADVITLHVPLTHKGVDPTYMLLDARILQRLRIGSWVVNTSRGGVIDESALKKSLEEGPVAAAVLDVWESEPVPDFDLHGMVDLGTAHIAGYSIDAKRAATRAIANGVCRFFGLDMQSSFIDEEEGTIGLLMPPFDPDVDPDAYINTLIRQMYAIESDHDRLMAARGSTGEVLAETFRLLRNDYPVRRSFAHYRLGGTQLSEALRDRLQSGLGIRIN